MKSWPFSNKEIKAFRVVLMILMLFTFSTLKSQTNLFVFNFNTNNSPSTNNTAGTPSISTVGTLSTGSSGCTGNGYSASAWDAGDGFQFTVNTTGFYGMTFSYNEQASNANISTFLVRASKDEIGRAHV